VILTGYIYVRRRVISFYLLVIMPEALKGLWPKAFSAKENNLRFSGYGIRFFSGYDMDI